MSAGVISNVQIATPDEAVRPVDLFLDDSGRIGAIVDAGSAPFDDALCLFDGQGEAIIFPGFIDIHTHGANGADLSMATAEAVSSMAEAKLSEGVTSFLPTTWTASPEHTISMLEAAAGYARDQKFARTPCVHIEGPFINPAQAGAQDPEQIRLPDAAELERWMEIVPIGILSLAPERQGACEMIASCRERGIITSAAHSAASHADFLLAKENGLQHMTHFCNQMSGLHHREIGLVGSGLCDPDIRLELICDGIHLGEDMLKLIFQQKPVDQLMLITDSVAASHLPEGTYQIGHAKITVSEGAARLPEGNLAGSTLKFNDGLRLAAEVSGLELPELAAISSTHQARALGLDDRGEIRPGMLADLAITDQHFEVLSTVVGGELRWRA